MKYLVTSWPVLLAHGHYSFDAVPHEEALVWFKEHHKQIGFGGFNTGGPHQQVGVRIDLVQLLAKEVDRYVDPSKNHNIGEINDEDEVLVVHGPQPRHNQPPTIGELKFAFFRRTREHHARHEEHEHAHAELEAVSV